MFLFIILAVFSIGMVLHILLSVWFAWCQVFVSGKLIHACYHIAGIICGGLFFAVFAVNKHPRKLNPRIIRLLHCLELSIKKTSVPSAHGVATVLQTSN